MRVLTSDEISYFNYSAQHYVRLHQTMSVKRIQLFDILRGIAIGLMATYHFCFDLNYYGFYPFQLHDDPFWLDFRALILACFYLWWESA